MITGSSASYWFSDLWYDLTHLGTASLPEVGFKLAVIFFGFLFAKAIFGVLWRVFYVELLRPILKPIFKVIFFPLRAPLLLWRSWRDQRRKKRNEREAQKRWDAQKREDLAKAEAERRHKEQSQIDELARLNQAAKID